MFAGFHFYHFIFIVEVAALIFVRGSYCCSIVEHNILRKNQRHETFDDVAFTVFKGVWKKTVQKSFFLFYFIQFFNQVISRKTVRSTIHFFFVKLANFLSSLLIFLVAADPTDRKNCNKSLESRQSARVPMNLTAYNDFDVRCRWCIPQQNYISLINFQSANEEEQNSYVSLFLFDYFHHSPQNSIPFALPRAASKPIKKCAFPILAEHLNFPNI